MNCANLMENGQPCGDEGGYCDECFLKAMQDHAWLKNVSKYAAGAPIDEAWEVEMRDAGRL